MVLPKQKWCFLFLFLLLLCQIKHWVYLNVTCSLNCCDFGKLQLLEKIDGSWKTIPYFRKKLCIHMCQGMTKCVFQDLEFHKYTKTLFGMQQQKKISILDSSFNKNYLSKSMNEWIMGEYKLCKWIILVYHHCLSHTWFV
jgi:hypothetical protein